MRPPPDEVSSDRYCWELCVAAILGIRAAEVPDVHAYAEESDGKRWEWWGPMVEWLRERGLTVAQRRFWEAGLPEGPYIAVGASPRIPESRHAVVAEDGEIVYDPASYDEDVLKIDAVYEIRTL